MEFEHKVKDIRDSFKRAFAFSSHNNLCAPAHEADHITSNFEFPETIQ
jgi:hypothetical protein